MFRGENVIAVKGLPFMLVLSMNSEPVPMKYLLSPLFSRLSPSMNIFPLGTSVSGKSDVVPWMYGSSMGWLLR